MKVLYSVLLMTFCGNLFAASITVKPFEMTFLMGTDYDIDAEIELACRYEKVVWSDSAEFETFYQAPTKLKVKKSIQGDFVSVQLINDKTLYFEYDRLFKLGKECRASYKVNFIHKEYAVGYGLKPYKPVTFQLWEGFYDYKEGDTVYNLKRMRSHLDQTTYTFREERKWDSQINIWILQDGKEADTNPWVEKAIINPVTGRPFPPRV